jgi:hypothetical protein
LRTNLTETDPVMLWNYYLQLTVVEEAFRTLKADLAIRPIFHQDQARIEAHIFIAFLAYCLYVTLGGRLRSLAPGLTARRALEKFAAVQMVDVHIPTTNGRELCLTRYTQPEADLKLVLRAPEAHAAGAAATENHRRPSPPPPILCSADLRMRPMTGNPTNRRP